ncbi:MAG: CRISPR-associated endonuclease Cas1 [Desulfococcaceae bacterium]
METLYVVENGLQLKKRSNRILVKKGGKTIEEYRTGDLKRVLVFGNSQITTELMRFLAGKGVDVAFLSRSGKFGYRLVPEKSRNIFLRMAHHDRYRDEPFRLRLSRAFIRGKVSNQRAFLVRYQRIRSGLDLSEALKGLKKSVFRSGEAENIEQLRGIEGNAGRIFFAAFGQLLLNDFHFSARRYHPPPDPVNAMLGFGYMLLFNELAGLLEAFGFDAYVGFLHEIRYGRKSLASDLMEEMRSPIVDRLVLYLINKGMIDKKAFTKEKGKCMMDDNSRKTFISNYEAFMKAPFATRNEGKITNFREVLRDRVKCLERAIMHQDEYLPFKFRS